MSMLYDDESDSDVESMSGGASMGGYSLGGKMLNHDELLGAGTNSLFVKLHKADKKAMKEGDTKAQRRIKLKKLIPVSNAVLKRVMVQHGVTSAKAKTGIVNRYFQALEEKKLSQTGNKGAELFSAKSSKVVKKPVKKPVKKSAKKPVKRGRSKATQAHINAVKRLAKKLPEKEKAELAKLLALLGKGFWGDLWDGIKSVASKAVDIAPALLPLVL